jgi:hypothetical protein
MLPAAASLSLLRCCMGAKRYPSKKKGRTATSGILVRKRPGRRRCKGARCLDGGRIEEVSYSPTFGLLLRRPGPVSVVEDLLDGRREGTASPLEPCMVFEPE